MNSITNEENISQSKTNPTEGKIKKKEKAPRKERLPLSKQKRSKFEPTPGYIGRIVVDYGGTGERIIKFRNAGWIHRDKNGNQMEVNHPSQLGEVATVAVGGGLVGYYMEVKEEYYDEDFAEKQLENDRIMRQIDKYDTIPRSLQRGQVRVDYSNHEPV